MNELNTNDRFDRIERLLETLSNNQITTQNQISQLATTIGDTQTQVLSIAGHLDSVSRHLDNVSRRLDSVSRHLDSLVSTAADMRTRQIITQNQIDSLAALSADTRQALMVLLQTSVNHEGRLDDLERGEDEPTP
jgi:chromosome segregation ATPase